MSNDRHKACCPRCGGHDFAAGIHIGLMAASADVGLGYKDGFLEVGIEPLRADICTACGTIHRLYVENVSHKWRTRVPVKR